MSFVDVLTSEVSFIDTDVFAPTYRESSLDRKISVEIFQDKEESAYFWRYQLFGLFVALMMLIYLPFKAFKRFRGQNFFGEDFVFSNVKALKVVRKNAAYSKSLDVIYNYFDRFGIEPGSVSDCRKNMKYAWLAPISDFLFNIFVARDVRSRLNFVSRTLEKKIFKIGKRKGDVKILSLAGGTNQDLIMAIANVQKVAPSIKISCVCVEPDGVFGLKRSKELCKLYGVDPDIFVNIRKITDPDKPKRTLPSILKQNNINFYAFDIVLCIGLGDYQFGDKLERFLKMLDNGRVLITANVSGNYVERLFLHKTLTWPRMQYLSLRKYKKVLQSVFINRKIRITQMPNKVFNVAVIE